MKYLSTREKKGTVTIKKFEKGKLYRAKHKLNFGGLKNFDYDETIGWGDVLMFLYTGDNPCHDMKEYVRHFFLSPSGRVIVEGYTPEYFKTGGADRDFEKVSQ